MERISKMIDIVESQNKNKSGISFYSGHEHQYIFIETHELQKVRFKCLVQLKFKTEDSLGIV